MGVRLSRAAPQDTRRTLAGVPPIQHYRDASGKYVRDTFRVPVRLFEGGVIDDRLGVEDDQVGGVALGDDASVAKAEPLGRKAGHLPDGVLQRQDGRLFPDVPTQDTRVGAVEAGGGGGGGGGRSVPYTPSGEIALPSDPIIACGWPRK